MPKIDVSTKPSDEEQLAHTVESMLKDEPENNEENGQGCVTTKSTPVTCPAGTALSGNVCAGHPIPKGPKPT